MNPSDPDPSHLGRGSELIEHVVVPLLFGLEGDPRLLEEVVLDHTALDLEPGVEADLHEPAEPGGVVVADRLGVACKRNNGELNF